jgi:hypothetical protein
LSSKRKAIPNTTHLPDWVMENLPKELVESTLFRFDIMLQVNETDENGANRKKTITVDILPDLKLDYEELEEQMMRLPAQYAFWAAIYSEVRNSVELMERAIKVRRGQAIGELLRSGREDNIKLTTDQVKQVLESDEQLVRLDEKLQRLQMQNGKLYHMMEALKMKAELSRSLAGFKRQEQSHN